MVFPRAESPNGVILLRRLPISAIHLAVRAFEWFGLTRAMTDNGWTGSLDTMHYQVLPSGCISCNAVVLWRADTRDAVVIDPTDDASAVIDFVRQAKLRVRQILLTHAHFDHAADTERAMEELGCPAHLHADDLPIYLEIPFHAPRFGARLPPRTRPLSQVHDNENITALPNCEIHVLHVPGHSPGSVTYYVPRAGWAFVGDTLFLSGVGRTDLPGGSSKKLITSIQDRLYALPDETRVVCGHGPATILGREKQLNPYVRAARVEPTP